jgi:sigma-E factor negative regulatory protein RseC
MKQQGLIIGMDGDNATVKVQRHAACRDCGGCELGHSNKSMEIKAKNPFNASMGELVEIEIPSNSVLKASFLVYILPIFFMVIGFFIGGRIGLHFGYNVDIAAGALGFGMLALAFLVIRLYDKKLGEGMTPIITNLINQ